MSDRHSIRLPGYDYSQSGCYFVTICTWGRESLFGAVSEGKMKLSKGGDAAFNCWQQIPQHYLHASIDVFTIMPNHIHGIIVINSVVS